MRDFKQRVRQAITNPHLQAALDGNAERRIAARLNSYASLPESLDIMRSKAHWIRQNTLAHLDDYLAEFTKNLETHGVVVHRADSARQAVDIVSKLAAIHNARLIAKSKSMLSEEIHLNEALAERGIKIVETDLGEFIIQLRGEKPTHIITPAVHLRREDVAKTFSEKLGMPYTTDVKAMVDVARRELRQTFLDADIGISGVNFGVAENGMLCLLTNEGNGRMVTTLPRLHIALMGIERLVPAMDDLALLLQLLSRSATGQKFTNYISLINAPHQEKDADGPLERHLILVDNGRSKLAQSDLAEVLFCIRCGACLNVCPVFRELGGHVYDSPYPGPIGSIVSPGLWGVERYGHLSKASSLCAACAEACPVKIDFPKLFLRLRHQYIEQTPQPFLWRVGMRLFAWGIEHSSVYLLGQKLASIGGRLLPRKSGWIRWLPPPAMAWTDQRDFPPFANRTFRQRFRMKKSLSEESVEPALYKLDNKIISGSLTGSETLQSLPPSRSQEPIDKFADEFRSLGGEFNLCHEKEVVEKIIAQLVTLNVESVISWGSRWMLDSVLSKKDDKTDEVEKLWKRLFDQLRTSDFLLLDADLPADPFERRERYYQLAKAEVGITAAVAALADTGTLALPGGGMRSQLASLLPPVHIVILRLADIYPSLTEWLRAEGVSILKQVPSMVLISGPSRTADIEMTLTIGVHGPGRVIVYGYY